MVSLEQRVFLELVKAGLWERDVTLREYEPVDYSRILQLATEQSVIGLVTVGLDYVKDVKAPQEWALQFVGQTIQLEQRNKAMNVFVAELIRVLRKQDIYALLVKGQGIAQCYEKPMWRASGDVDLFLSDDNYQKAMDSLKAKASSVDDENPYNKHLAMVIDGWIVEIHGSLRCGLWKKADKELDVIKDDIFFSGKVRSWMNGNTQIFLPAANEDVVFVFTHILEHYFKEGIGLRQICDWCRLLWTYKESLDHVLLESRIRQMGVMSEWKTFSTLAIKYLGMPREAMPLYSDSRRLGRKADKVMEFILETGNFGHNRDYSYRQKHSYVVFKAISLWRHIADTFRYFEVFPLDSIKVFLRKMQVGLSVAIQGKRHE